MAHHVEHQVDPNTIQPGYLPGNDYTTPHSSQYTRTNHLHAQMLGSMNCGYLSTPGVPPTLLALKQHAQSLAYLISLLNPSIKYGEVGPGPTDAQDRDAAKVVRKFEKNEAFDWLASLTERYENDDPNHNAPLNFLLNDVRGRDDVFGTDYHCPLAEFAPRAPGQPQYPYANHHSLVMHTNQCLERLDHEFSSTGGVLSLLGPMGIDTAEQRAARNSLLGQWLVYTQQLVGRMHELETSYANALDALAGEAVVPLQHMSSLGPDGRTAGREIAYPQDRFVLVNAGGDVFDFIHGLLDQKEAVHGAQEAVWGDGGVSSERMRGGEGDEVARGIVVVDVQSRFYRLVGVGHSTLFVLPAWEKHPGVAHTASLERAARPTVVSSVQPKFPQRATELEQRYQGRLDRLSKVELENISLVEQDRVNAAQVQTLSANLERERAINKTLGEKLAKLKQQNRANRNNDRGEGVQVGVQ